ncbi:unnamed protein product [Paramecium sonneborni]|uniref:Uncharacterized protein n=1 Tax=Paramecium sonneborni TaxID=65129 RepID=A0A8S1RNS6_9CILI|nr:unnamed protein product [Paramecium sonneborni]
MLQKIRQQCLQQKLKERELNQKIKIKLLMNQEKIQIKIILLLQKLNNYNKIQNHYNWNLKEYDLIKELDQKYHDALKYQEQVSQLETQVFDLQGKVAMLSSEIKKQRIKLDKYKKDNDGQQDKINQLNDIKYDFESMQEALQRYKSQEDQQQHEYDSWRELLKKADLESTELQKTQETLSSEKQIAQDQYEKLNEQIDELKQITLRRKIQNRRFIQRNRKILRFRKQTMLSADIERRSVKEKTKQQQFDELQQHSKQQQDDLTLNEAIKKTQDEIMNTKKNMKKYYQKEEIKKIRQLYCQLKLKDNHIDQKKIEECSQLNEKNQILQGEVLRLQDQPAQVEDLTQQVEELRHLLNEADLKQVKLTQDLDSVAHEKALIEAEIQKHQDEAKLQQQLTEEAKKQLANFTEKFKSVEDENSSLRTLESKLSEYQMKTALLASQIEAQNKKYQGKLDEMATLQQNYNDLKAHQLDVEDIQGELERTITILNEKDKEHGLYDKKIQDLEAQIKQLEDIKYQLESKMAMVSSEVERVKYKYEKLQKEYEENHQRLLEAEEHLVENNKEVQALEDELHQTQQELAQARKTQ